MKTSIRNLLALALLLCAATAQAQFEGAVYEEDTSVLVNFSSGVKMKIPWCGGFNNPQFTTGDINNDGLSDLVVYFSDQSIVKTFLNYGSASAPDYRYRPEYAKNFPTAAYYLTFRDYNKDNVPDLFEAGLAGFTVHKGYYNSANQLCFTVYKSLFYTNDKKTVGPVNAEVNPGDIPAIVDVDNDGDLDFLSYYGDGYYMRWYQNLQIEKGYPADSITIRLADNCWGKMVQGTLRTHTLGITCDNSALSRTTDDEYGKLSKVTDGGNTPCLLDMDGDGDYDVLDGHRAFNYVVYLENSKAATGLRDSMIYQDTAYTTLGDTVKIAQWAAVFHLDVDGDAQRDLLVAPNSPLVSENYRCIQYYKNIGTDKFPLFKYQSDTFLISESIDLGSQAYPFFYDYDRDGKPDLFVGSKGYYNTATGQLYSALMYFRNESTPGNPVLRLISKDFLNLAARKYQGMAPTVGDLDNDGKDDLVFGHADGTLHWIKNTALTPGALPNWAGVPQIVTDDVGANVSSNGAAAPLVYDMNADGVNDLVIGDQTGYLFYYQNSSKTAGTFKLIYTNDQLGFAKSDPEKKSTGYSTPFIGKMDNSGRPFLLMGSRSGRIFRYTGFEGGAIFASFKRLDSAYSYILGKDFQGHSMMSAPAVADIDGDGRYEMVVGNTHGGLFLYHQNKLVSVSEFAEATQNELILFPNPAQNELHLGLNQTKFEKQTSVIIYNTLGQTVLSTVVADPSGDIQLDISNLAPGNYWCSLRSGQSRFTGVFVKQTP